MISWRTNGLPEPVWVEELDKLSGMPEVIAGKLNPIIVDMFRCTRFPLDKLTTKTPWCAAAACYALERRGYRSPRSAAASAFKNYGIAVPVQYGAWAFFPPSNPDAGGTGHITCIVGIDHDSILCLGGNQALRGVDTGSMRRKWFKLADMADCRYPTQADAIAKR